MRDLMTQSELLRRAVKWISDHLKEDSKQDKKKLVQEAIFRFDLPPKESEFLIQMYREN
jgi:hypothetical protein